jgi:hypothetical protein
VTFGVSVTRLWFFLIGLDTESAYTRLTQVIAQPLHSRSF